MTREQQACAQAREADLYWRANAVLDLATIARDAMAPGRGSDLVRAELTLKKIATLASGGELEG